MRFFAKIGVVSDFDLLAIDRKALVQDVHFPPTDQTWQVIMDKVSLKLKLIDLFFFPSETKPSIVPYMYMGY